MKPFWTIILQSLLPTAAIWFITRMMGTSNSRKSNQLYYPIKYLLIYAVVLLGIIAGTIYSVCEKDFALLLPLVIVGLPLLALFVNYSTWRIAFFDDYWMFRRKRYSYDDITKIVYLHGVLVFVFVGEKRITIESFVVNTNSFVQILKKKRVFKNAEVIRKD